MAHTHEGMSLKKRMKLTPSHYGAAKAKNRKAQGRRNPYFALRAKGN